MWDFHNRHFLGDGGRQGKYILWCDICRQILSGMWGPETFSLITAQMTNEQFREIRSYEPHT